MLEVACHALAELAYRASLPIEDLVLRPSDSPEQTLQRTRAQFLAPAEALGTRPWTEADWRRLLIDLPGVKNAWLAADERSVLYADLPAPAPVGCAARAPGLRHRGAAWPAARAH